MKASAPPAPFPLHLLDSVGHVQPAMHGAVLVSGSHGGRSAAQFVIGLRPRLVVFNDAGLGRDGAGIAGLALLQDAGLAACTVAHSSARIGEAESTLADGIVSHANAAAAALGIAAGMACREAVRRAGAEAGADASAG
jgi:hypothetical protein